MNDFIETKIVHLKCLSPIHIGSGDKLDKNQYVFDKDRGIVYLLKMNQWLNFLTKEGTKSVTNIKSNNKSLGSFTELGHVLGHKSNALIESYKNFIFNRKKGQFLYCWCVDNEISINKLDTCCFAKAYIASDKKDLNDLMPLIRHIDGSVYIPGSSIKGAMRTALLCYLIKKSPACESWRDTLRKIINSVNQRNIDKYYKCFANKIEQLIFYKCKEYDPALQNARADIMRGLRISDAKCHRNIKTKIYRKVDISLHKGKTGNIKKLPLYREYIPSETEFTFTITVEKQFMKMIGINNVNELIKTITWQTNKIIDLEKSVFNEYDKCWSGVENEANLIMGGGAGFLSKTIMYSILPKAEAVNAVKSYLDLAFSSYNKRLHKRMPKHKHVLLDRELSPRTLKVAGDINTLQQIGLVKLTVD